MDLQMQGYIFMPATRVNDITLDHAFDHIIAFKRAGAVLELVLGVGPPSYSHIH
jgi:hypothetical protein